MLKELSISKSTYMYWQRKEKEEDKDKEIKSEIKKIAKENPCYGYRRITAKLHQKGIKVNHKKVLKITKEENLQVKNYSKRTSKYRSYKGVVGKTSENIINRNFKSEAPYTKITTDTTEMKYYTKGKNNKLQTQKLYLMPYLDMYSLEIISYSISKVPNYMAVDKSLQGALKATSGTSGKIFHSDQGWMYQQEAYTKALEDNQIQQSMSRKGNCLDNSIMENFFSILKREIYIGKTYYSYEQLEKAIEEYIQYYNNERIKERLGYCSPVQYRNKYFESIQ